MQLSSVSLIVYVLLNQSTNLLVVYAFLFLQQNIEQGNVFLLIIHACSKNVYFQKKILIKIF